MTAFKEHRRNNCKIMYQFLTSRSRSGHREFVNKETSEIGVTTRTMMNEQ